MQPPIPKPFVATALQQFDEVTYRFLLHAPMDLQDFAKNLACVSRVEEMHRGTEEFFIYINPRYNAQEAYDFILDQLKSESDKVELGSNWPIEEVLKK